MHTRTRAPTLSLSTCAPPPPPNPPHPTTTTHTYPHALTPPPPPTPHPQCMVFSWSGCPFCKKAKAVLDGTGAKYLALELDTMGQEGKAIRAELARCELGLVLCRVVAFFTPVPPDGPVLQQRLGRAAPEPSHHHLTLSPLSPTRPHPPAHPSPRARQRRMTERSSVPQVFIAGKFVGGCNDGPGVATLQDKGELVPMLQAAGAL